MITNEVQYRATRAHLAGFDEVIANLEAKAASEPGSKLTARELDAVRLQADDL